MKPIQWHVVRQSEEVKKRIGDNSICGICLEAWSEIGYKSAVSHRVKQHELFHAFCLPCFSALAKNAKNDFIACAYCRSPYYIDPIQLIEVEPSRTFSVPLFMATIGNKSDQILQSRCRYMAVTFFLPAIAALLCCAMTAAPLVATGIGGWLLINVIGSWITNMILLIKLTIYQQKRALPLTKTEITAFGLFLSYISLTAFLDGFKRILRCGISILEINVRSMLRVMTGLRYARFTEWFWIKLLGVILWNTLLDTVGSSVLIFFTLFFFLTQKPFPELSEYKEAINRIKRLLFNDVFVDESIATQS